MRGWGLRLLRLLWTHTASQDDTELNQVRRGLYTRFGLWFLLVAFLV